MTVSGGKVFVTINGGSSSIKFAVFAAGDPLRRMMSGSVERIGLPGAALTVKNGDESEPQRVAMDAATLEKAAAQVAQLLHERLGRERIAGIGHRVVHGGLHLTKSQRLTPEVMAALREAQPLDLAHLPGELALIEAFQAAFADVPQVACFDTAFHRDMPRVAKLLPIPRRYLDAGLRRFGFHGLSYTFLMRELARVAGPEAARGKVILAHLGSGASMAAVNAGKPVDTTMAFTPTAGLVMGSRPGDIDPGLLVYLMRAENLTAEQMDDFVNRRCGLLGMSATSSDMRDLLSRRSADTRAAEAVELFCYQARKWIGALATTLGGIDTLVFSAGIGEHAPEIRAEICGGLKFLGLDLDTDRNTHNAAVISKTGGPAAIRIIATDEEIIIAQSVCDILAAGGDNAVLAR